MFTPETLRHFNTGFELGDIFGKGRMRELIFNMKEQLCEDQSEIEKWRMLAASQAELITKLYAKIDSQSREVELQAKVDALQAQLESVLSERESLKIHASDLEQQLNDTHISDLEAYRILSAMRSNSNWKNTEVC